MFNVVTLKNSETFCVLYIDILNHNLKPVFANLKLEISGFRMYWDLIQTKNK